MATRWLIRRHRTFAVLRHAFLPVALHHQTRGSLLSLEHAPLSPPHERPRHEPPSPERVRNSRHAIYFVCLPRSAVAIVVYVSVSDVIVRPVAAPETKGSCSDPQFPSRSRQFTPSYERALQPLPDYVVSMRYRYAPGWNPDANLPCAPVSGDDCCGRVLYVFQQRSRQTSPTYPALEGELDVLRIPSKPRT